MDIDLASALPALLPRAISWAKSQEKQALTMGTQLTSHGIGLARAVGVHHCERIRVWVVDALPLPLEPDLRQAALQAGLLAPGMTGLTLGYGVLICKGQDANPRLLRHEFRHVHQYEIAGSLEAFLPVYLAQIVQFGYQDAPFELDARAHEEVSASFD